MKKLIKRCIRFAFRVSPGLSSTFWGGMRYVILRKERTAYRGGLVTPSGERSSIVFFSHNRCASMMLNRRIEDLLEGLGFLTLDYQRFAHPWPIEKKKIFQSSCEEHREVGRFPSQMIFYKSFRYFVDIPDLEKLSTILVLRDPRDVITSRFFSEAFAHVAIDKRFFEHTERVRSMDIDTFVMTFAADVEEHYKLFRDNFDKIDHGVFWRYEDLIADFAGFLTEVNSKFDLGKSKAVVEEIAAKETFQVAAEDQFSHKRSVQAGAYKRKLKPETIKYLNQLFEETLVFFGWEKEEV